MAKLSWYNVTIALVIGLGGFSYGFGSAVFVTSLGQPGFYIYYGLDPTSARMSPQPPWTLYRRELADTTL